MMPLSLEKRILVSTPKEVTYKGTVYPIAVEKSRFADVEYLLKIRPIVVTLNIFGDRDRGRGHTPTNFYNRGYYTQDRNIYQEYIMRMAATLSINLHVARTDTMDYDQLLDKAVNAYLGWQMWELRDTGIEVYSQHGAVTDRSHLERGIVRKQFDIPIQYQFTLPLKKLTTIDYIEGSVTVDTEEDKAFFSESIPQYY